MRQSKDRHEGSWSLLRNGYAPGATGNIVTEDLVFMLEAMGLRTGIDVDALIIARGVLLHGLPNEAIYGNVPEVGLPKGFTYANSTS